MKNNIELLSPAGNKDSFLSAINAGADAIYMGLDRFNARTMAKNFNVDEYIESIKYAHMIGVKVYLTLNTLVYDEEIKDALIPNDFNMIVTPKEIDDLIENMGSVVARGINFSIN